MEGDIQGDSHGSPWQFGSILSNVINSSNHLPDANNIVYIDVYSLFCVLLLHYVSWIGGPFRWAQCQWRGSVGWCTIGVWLQRRGWAQADTEPNGLSIYQ